MMLEYDKCMEWLEYEKVIEDIKWSYLSVDLKNTPMYSMMVEDIFQWEG